MYPAYSVCIMSPWQTNTHKVQILFTVDVMSCIFFVDVKWGLDSHSIRFLSTLVITWDCVEISIWFIKWK